MLTVKPIALLSHCHEELGAILIPLSIIGHCNNAPVRESQSLVELIHEWLSVDAFATPTCACRVTSLNHEILNHSMKHSAIVITLHTELNEVPTGSWSLFGPQIDLDLTIVGLEDYFCGGRWLL